MFENEINYSPSASDNKPFLLLVNGLDYFSTDLIKRHYPEQTFSFCHSCINQTGTNFRYNNIRPFRFALQ
ncbi:hypothetical protein IMSAG025_01895 [Muribaculaceae bacterium]|nr:hypothetical protein IMSAG025_01895 [Muribaculaceae bacterium]